MHTRISLWTLAALMVVLSVFVVDVRRTYAQEEEEVVVTQVFVVSNSNQRNNAARSNAQPCQVTAELRWYKKKVVSVIYHWQACADTPADIPTDIQRVRWEIASIHTAYGNLALSPAAGEANVYKEKWPDLAAGDKITLRTWINDIRQADVVTEYQESSPIWTRIHTRTDQGGACFQFTGHVDPWGVFTAGDQSYTFELTAQDWETPWLKGPNQPTVDWHVVFYRDAALTDMRTEYWFNNVANPCHTPPTCDGIALSIANGTAIPDAGVQVEVTITGQNGERYRIVDSAGTEVAGPSVDTVLTFHAMPGIPYQAQVYREGYGWTKSGCQFAYTTAPRPACDGVELSIPTTDLIPRAGADVEVTINGQHGTHYRIVDAAGTVLVGPSTENILQLHVIGGIRYQAQVYNATYGWTTAGCEFEYTAVDRGDATCENLAFIPANPVIPESGANVQVIITARNTTSYPLEYRIVDASGGVMAGPSSSNQLSMYAMPLVEYHAEVYNQELGWLINQGCAFKFRTPPPPPTSCEGIVLNIPSGASIPESGTEVQVTITGKNAVNYRIMDDKNNVVAGPSTDNSLGFHALPDKVYQAQVAGELLEWTNQGCQFSYNRSVPLCKGVALSIANGSSIPASGAQVEVTVDAENATNYQIVDGAGTVVVEPSSTNRLSFHALPDTLYQAQVADASLNWTNQGCQFIYDPSAPLCTGVGLSIPNGSLIPESGADVKVTVMAENATSYQIVDEAGTVVVGPSETPTFQFHAMPLVTYQAQVSNTTHAWTKSGCQFGYGIENTPSCEGVDLSMPNESEIAASGTDVQVTINGRYATNYQIVDNKGNTMAGPSSDPVMHFHAMPGMVYQAQVANEFHAWTTNGCQFRYGTGSNVTLASCELHASHYGDPGGISRITAWVDDKTTVAIEKIEVNWNHRGTVTYPTKEQPGPWFTNTPFELDSRPDVHDIGFGYYRFEALVYVAGISEPAFCTGDGNAPDHDNVLPDPGPFAKANPEGKFNRGGGPSRLPTVGRLPFDGGNGPDKVELILWAFEKEGRGMGAHITAIANEGKPLARIGMESVSNVVKFDGLNAREGIVYGFQIGEHGPWSPLFCPKADGNPTTITVYWAAGGQTWLSDGAAFGDCWWLTVSAALNGWVTVDESVATYNALQGIIDWNGHRNLTFSLAQSRETGLGPRMQDEVIGLTAREWQGPVIPTIIPPDFWQVVDGYRNAQ